MVGLTVKPGRTSCHPLTTYYYLAKWKVLCHEKLARNFRPWRCNRMEHQRPPITKRNITRSTCIAISSPREIPLLQLMRSYEVHLKT